ncbi:UDP-2,3-diacylglucosamine diphosphatase [Thioalkalicoccus limnaeus]|uniref:UDP-2,3-diacylglucosamine diphosphatase n=1 Tax=Thioalkalicoccus limnaeus TaxID=120681 RepID=A0ABV4BE29_9GAMM
MTRIERSSSLRYRSIWISDTHLGSRGCQADFLLDFLRSTESQNLYLVGDIVDVWAMHGSLHWPTSHNGVVGALFDKARNGTRVVYLPGNHDELFRAHVGHDFARIAVRDEVIHTTADGRRFLVTHGDRFDGVVQNGRWLARIGSRAYDLLLVANRLVNLGRRLLGLPYWSLAAYLKHKVKDAVDYIGRYERSIAAEAHRHAFDGMICGHIHKAAMRDIDGILYCNCGDWVESCTALVEHHDGRLELLGWTDAAQVSLTAWEPATVWARAS